MGSAEAKNKGTEFDDMNEIIAGRQPVLEALKSGTSIEKIVFLHGIKGSITAKIRQLARERGVPVTEVDKHRFGELAKDSSSQGVLALVTSHDYVEVDEILEIAGQRSEPAFLMVLDEIEDPHNLGALIRTAECAGVHGVIIPKHHSASMNATVAKTSSGASLHLPAARVTNIAQTLEELKKRNVWIVGTDASSDRLYYDVDYKQSIAIVIGGEGKGIRRLVKEKCDFLVKIPMAGKIESLNASVAGALVLYEVRRARTR